jgi:hypothetical protein
MNIFPKYSQYILVKYLGGVDQFDAKQLFADSEWTFPGLFLNHNANVQVSYQQESASDNYRYGDNFFYPRGYSRPYYQVTQSNYLLYDRMLKIGANYHFPIAYPDGGLPGIIYFYRARGNAFFDHGKAWFSREGRPEIDDVYNSFGGELVLDTRLLNTYDMSFGVRFSYLLNQNPLTPGRDYLWEFFIPVQRF